MTDTTGAHAATEQHEFRAETRQVLDLMIHSVYSNKDTFLRELISNSSDALDKLRLEAYQDKDLDVDTSDLHIELEPDAAARTLVVRDNGIGMTRDEVVDLIGTLARSGTAQVRAALAEARTQAATDELIGQFGIGFYSTFMVADKVELTTRKAGEATGTHWESTGEGTYTVSEVSDAPQGTAVTLHLKPVDEDDHLYDYTSTVKLEQIVRKYSDFISWPIRMEITRTSKAEDGTDEVTVEDRTLNSTKALWTRPADEVSEDELTEFYRHVSHGWDTPLETIRFRAEGTFEYQALLFIPGHAPFDLFQREQRLGVQLYVRRVFIMDDCDELLPEYLRFVKGIVDAQDLSLNVSREILQQDRQIRAIRKRLTRKILQTIRDLARTDAARFTTLWQEFGRVLKEGLISDEDNRELLLEIARFASTTEPAAGFDTDTDTAATDTAATDTGTASDATSAGRSLRDYVDAMKDGQKAIYYLTGESRAQLEASPHMEAFRARGIEVLLLTDPVDEVWTGTVREFDGTPLQSIAKGEVDLDETSEDDTEQKSARAEEFEPLTSWLTGVLGDHVRETRLTTRLTDSPACLVGDTFAMSPALERMYRASGADVPSSKRILELNPDHPLVAGLRTAHADRPDDAAVADTARLLYGTALLAEGGELDDPAAFAKLLAARLTADVTGE